MKNSHKVWWLCMLPSFAAMAMLGYEYSLDPEDSRLLVYTMLCPIIGVVFGAVIVGLNHGAEENKKLEENASGSAATPLAAPSYPPQPDSGLSEELSSECCPKAPAPNLTEELAACASAHEKSELIEESRLEVPEVVTPTLEQPFELLDFFPELQDQQSEELKREPVMRPEQATMNAMERTAKASSGPQAADTNAESNELPNFSTSHEWLSFAEQLYDQENYDQAIKCFDKVTALDPQNFEAWYQKSLALSKKGRKEDALYCLNYCSRIRESSPVVFAEKGSCLLELGRAEQALSCFEKSLSLDQIAVKPWLGKGRCLSLMGRHKDAINCYDKVLALQPENEEARNFKVESSKKLSHK